MNTRKIKGKLKKAHTGLGILNSACGSIAEELQPFFGHEISVEFQPSDGFVVIWEANDGCAPHNVPVMDAVEKIKNNPNTFIST